METFNFQQQYRYGGCVMINNKQTVWEYPVAPNVAMYFIDEAARKLYKKYGVQYGQCPIEEYDYTPVPVQQQDDRLGELLKKLDAMQGDIDKLKGGVQNDES